MFFVDVVMFCFSGMKQQDHVEEIVFLLPFLIRCLGTPPDKCGEESVTFGKLLPSFAVVGSRCLCLLTMHTLASFQFTCFGITTSTFDGHRRLNVAARVKT